MAFLPIVKVTPDSIRIDTNNYICLTDILGIFRYRTKNLEGIVVSIIGIEIDINLFTERLPRNNLNIECELLKAMLKKRRMMLLGAYTLTSCLSFCAKVVWLDGVCIRRF